MVLTFATNDYSVDATPRNIPLQQATEFTWTPTSDTSTVAQGETLITSRFSIDNNSTTIDHTVNITIPNLTTQIPGATFSIAPNNPVFVPRNTVQNITFLITIPAS